MVDRTRLELVTLDVKPSGVAFTPTGPTRIRDKNRKTPEKSSVMILEGHLCDTKS